MEKNWRFLQKLKENTQNLRKTLNVSEDLSSPTLSSDVKKKPGLPTLIDSLKFLQARRIIIKILQANQAHKNELQATANYYYQREGKTRKNWNRILSGA